MTLVNDTFSKEDLTFNINGYYYKVVEKESRDSNYKEITVSPIIFYDDGYVWKSEMNFVLGSYVLDEERDSLIKNGLIGLEERIRGNNLYHLKRKRIWDWGVYRMVDNRLKIQHYSNHLGDYTLYETDFEVLDDKTLKQVYSYGYFLRGRKPDEIVRREKYIYHFKPFDRQSSPSNYIKKHIKRFGYSRFTK